MDNATAEYSFIASFFFVGPLGPPPSAKEPETGQLSITPESKEVEDNDSAAGSEVKTPVAIRGIVEAHGSNQLPTMDKAERTELSNLWKKIFDPALDYTKACHAPVRAALTNLTRLLDIFRHCARTSTASNSPPHHGPTDGGRHCRSSKTPVCASGDVLLRHAPAALACISKSHFRAL